jgi:hypothetical protein
MRVTFLRSVFSFLFSIEESLKQIFTSRWRRKRNKTKRQLAARGDNSSFASCQIKFPAIIWGIFGIFCAVFHNFCLCVPRFLAEHWLGNIFLFPMLDPKLCDPPKCRQLFTSRKGEYNIPEPNLEQNAPWKYNYYSVGPDTPCLVLNPKIPYCADNSPFKYLFAYLIINSFWKCYFYSSFENVLVFLLINIILFKCHFWMIHFKKCSGTAFQGFFWYFSLSISHITACAPDYVNAFIDAAYAVAYLLRRDRVAHDNSRIPRWAQTQKEIHEAGTVPAPESLIGCNGFCKVCWRTMVVAAKWVCQNNKSSVLKLVQHSSSKICIQFP